MRESLKFLPNKLAVSAFTTLETSFISSRVLADDVAAATGLSKCFVGNKNVDDDKDVVGDNGVIGDNEVLDDSGTVGGNDVFDENGAVGGNDVFDDTGVVGDDITVMLDLAAPYVGFILSIASASEIFMNSFRFDLLVRVG